MNPDRVVRDRVRVLTDLPNVGPAIAADLELIGIRRPADLVGVDALDLYERLCRITGERHDPCVADVFLSAVAFMDGGQPRRWWSFTEQRKRAWPQGWPWEPERP